MRERGLKHESLRGVQKRDTVAPHAGAWIETPADATVKVQVQMSLPMRERGLKRR